MRTRLSAALVVLVALSISGGAFAQEPSGPAPEATATATATPVATAAPPLTGAAKLGGPAEKTRFEISAVFTHDPHTMEDLGLRTTTTPAGWKVGVAADLYRQTGTAFYVTSSPIGPIGRQFDQVLELDLGGRLSFTDEGAVRPWAGSGAGVFNVDGRLVPGLWVGTGIDVIVARTLDLGLLFHYATAHSRDYVDGNGEIELGSTTVGATVGLVF